ncbi:MAG: hypothetical protein K0U86_18900, partial [Planctomycetes bacterium]|nr:hypothetical protein [Planctomycetota bacterium]MCH9726978.1 hypothetical protein [Planctomycetota bacterium]MCH9775233.1 hypothetical protein [Planctomycetota bacterium]
PPLLQKSELSTTKSLTHKSVGDHLGATLLIQFTTSRQALRFLAGVYRCLVRSVDRSKIQNLGYEQFQKLPKVE